MKYRELGRTGISVSTIGLGCSGFWGDKRFSDASAAGIVHDAFDRGVNFFDTGSNYSNFNAEPRLGRAIAPLIASGKRTELVISTKGGSTLGYAPTVADNDLSHADFSPDAIERSCLRSIQNLGCDYIDIFQLHGLDPATLTEELFVRLRQMKRDGLIRAIGVNTHFAEEMRVVATRPDVFDMVLIDCNLLQLDRFDVIQEMIDAGIGVVVGTVLAQGHLINRKIGSIRNGSFFWYLARTMLKPTTREFSSHAAPMRSALRSVRAMSPSQAAFAYLLRNNNITSCLFGTTSRANLKETVAAADLELSQEDVATIERAASGIVSLSR